ncbi:MAG TPA: hypothetical protein PLW80_07565, partial [Spirochaetales bacterium]|nr:hypothetical protein [Spirochaetales bacterium]
ESVAFIGCSGGVYYDADSKRAYTAVDASGVPVDADGKALAKPKAAGCIVASFSLSAMDGYATPASAAMPAGKALTGDAAVDIVGKARSEPWTIGAYEL